MKTKAELLAAGREAAERLRLTGDHPQALRKIDDILAAPAAVLHGGTLQKLSNLLALVAVKPRAKK